MSDGPTITAGGLARDANGNIADMPSELVSVLSEELLNLVGFLQPGSSFVASDAAAATDRPVGDAH